jgi:hypothetical protein
MQGVKTGLILTNDISHGRFFGSSEFGAPGNIDVFILSTCHSSKHGEQNNQCGSSHTENFSVNGVGFLLEIEIPAKLLGREAQVKVLAKAAQEEHDWPNQTLRGYAGKIYILLWKALIRG